MHAIKDVKIIYALNGASLFLPEEELLEDEADGGVGNRDYYDMRGCSWADTAEVIKYENCRVAETLPLPQDEADDLEDECYDDDCQYLCGIDLGVAGVVFALSAVGCATVASCNGGAFGGSHHESYPLVVFYAKPEHAPLLQKCAQETGVGLGREHGGSAIVFADDILKMPLFAQKIYDNRDIFDAINILP